MALASPRGGGEAARLLDFATTPQGHPLDQAERQRAYLAVPKWPGTYGRSEPQCPRRAYGTERR